MGMSKKARALLTAEKTSEWNKYQIEMQDAFNEFKADQAKAESGQKSKSGWSKLAGAVLFGAAIMATGGLGVLAGTTAFGAGSLSIGAGGWAAAAGATTAVAAGAAGAYAAHEWQDDVLLGGGKTKEDYLADIYSPKFGAGRATAEKSAFGGDIERDISALKAYEEGGLESALFENVGRSSSYISPVS